MPSGYFLVEGYRSSLSHYPYRVLFLLSPVCGDLPVIVIVHFNQDTSFLRPLFPFPLSLFLFPFSHPTEGLLSRVSPAVPWDLCADRDRAASAMEGIKLATLNVNGINIPSKRRAIFSSLREHNLDFYCIQETHSTDATINLWQSEWGGKIYSSSGLQNARGVAVLVKRALKHKIVKQARDTKGRILLLDVEILDTVYTVGSVYAPTQDKPQDQLAFIDELESLLDTMASDKVLLGGDFNALLNPKLDKNSQSNSSAAAVPYRARITSLLEDRLLCDLWRTRLPEARGYTFRRGAYMSRLDYLFISNHL